MMQNKKGIDIGGGGLDIAVDGQIVLHIAQVSDDDTINLFLYPAKGAVIDESIIHKEINPDDDCTHELLMQRKDKDMASKVFVKLSEDGSAVDIKSQKADANGKLEKDDRSLESWTNIILGKEEKEE